MIRKLRIRFVVITMASVFIVLGIIMSFTNFFNFTKVRTDADNMLYLIEDYDGKLEEYLKELEEIEKEKEKEKAEQEKNSESSTESSSGLSSEESSEKDDESESEGQDESSSESVAPEKEEVRPILDFISKETPYETRFFMVKYGEETTVDLEHIASVSEEEAISLAEIAMKSGKTTDYQGSYRFLVSRDRNMVIFLDCNRQLESARDFLSRSVLVSIITACFVFLFVFFISTRVVAPMVESYERQKRFITDAGHELKTPLTIISASNELIEMTDGESDNTRAIAKQVSRMSSMVKNLSALSSLDETTRLSQKTEFSLSVLLHELCELFEGALKKENRAFERSICENVSIFGDEAHVRELFSILLENASKYAISKTSVSLSRAGKRVVAKISNDATNIKNGELNRCFERFYRSDEARASGKEGSGIGLCVAKEIAELHDAEISAFGLDGIFTIKVVF